MASKTIIIQSAILAYAQNLFTPGQPPNYQPGQPLRYNCQFLVDAGSPQYQQIADAIREIAQKEWKERAEFMLNSIAGNPNKMCFIDGNRRDPSKYKGFKDRWGLSANRPENNGAPALVDQARNPITQGAGLLYGGAIVNAKVDLFTYDKNGGGIASGLVAVQFRAHGESFGGAAPASADGFEDLSAEDGDANAFI